MTGDIIALILITLAALSSNSIAIWEMEDTALKTVLHVMSYVIILAMFAVAWGAMLLPDYEDGQIDALKGDYKYEQQFVYRDTVLIDTIYVKIEE